MPPTRRSVLGTLAAVTLAGCVGSNDGDGTSPTDTPSPTESPTPAAAETSAATSAPTATPTPTERPTPTPTSTLSPTPTATPASAQQQYPDYTWGQLDGVEPVPDSEVVMSDFAFEPLVAAVKPGTEVTVRNEDSAGHSVTAPRLGVDRTVSSGDEITFSVTETGTFDYVCTFHPPDMLGRIVVTEETPTPTPTPTPTATPTPTDATTTEDDGYY